MKILIITDVAPPLLGGGEVYVTQLGSQLVSLGHEIHWLTCKLPNTKEYEIYHGIHIHRIPILFTNRFYFPGRQTFPIMLSLKKLDFVRQMDIVQSNTFVAGYSGWRVARKYKKPSLLFCHEFFGALWRKIGQNFLERNIYPIIERRIAKSPYDWYACPSEYSKSTMINVGAPADRITVIPHGIEHKLFNMDADTTYFRKKFGLENLLLFGYVGRLRIKSTTQSKNLLTLLKATKIVTEQIPDARLVLAGGGYQEEMRTVVHKMGLDKQVVYIGNISYEQNPKFLRMCDVIICPAFADGFCFLLAEASACGCLVIATDAGAHKERVIPGKTGYLVPTSTDEIAGTIIRAMRDRDKSRSLGIEGHRSAKELTWEKSARKHIQLYEKMICGTAKK